MFISLSLALVLIKSSYSAIIEDFGFKTTGGQYAGSGEETELTLVYDSNVYKCRVTPSSISTEYSCQGSTSLIGTNCGNKQEIFLENTDYVPEIDAVIIDYIFITDSDGVKQTIDIDTLCLDRDDCGQNTALVNINTGVISNKGGSYSTSCSSNVIQSFGFKTTTGQYAGSGEPTELTLIYDSIRYKCMINPSQINFEYSCDGPSSVKEINCGDNQEMFLENTDYVPEIDAVIINYIFITDSDGIKQTVSLNGLCLDRDDCGQNTALVNIDSGVISNKGGSYISSCPSDIIQSFGFKTTGGRYAGAGYPTEITLSFDNIVYQCQVTPRAISTEYSCDGANSLIGTNCGNNNNQEMFLENTDYRTTGIDGVIIDYIFFTGSDGIKQTISLSNLCLDVYDCGQNTASINLGTNAISKGATNSISCDAASLGLPAINMPHQDYNYNDDLNDKYYINDNGYTYQDYNDYNNYNNNNNNGEYVISLSSGQMIVILVILMVILSVNIVCMWQKNKNKGGYAVVKYESDFNESEAKAINVRAQ